jgi:O-antigen ligase
MTYMVVIILLYSLGLVMAYKTPYLQNRVSEVMNKGISLDPRWVTFHCGLKVFLANPLIGSGLGDVENLGLTCYEEKGFTEGIINRYHFHNEFIQIAAYSGLIGLISFCGLILSIIIRAIKKRGVIEVSFLVLFLLACQTESLLSRNKGILFFSFFSTLFFISNHEKDSTR